MKRLFYFTLMFAALVSCTRQVDNPGTVYIPQTHTVAVSTMSISPTDGYATAITTLSPAVMALTADNIDATTTAQPDTEQIFLTASVVEHYRFLGWTITGADAADITGTQWDGQYDTTTYGDAEVTLYLKSDNIVATANYLPLLYTLGIQAFSIDPTTGAATVSPLPSTVTLPGPKLPTEQISLTAPVVEHYRFLGWTITGVDAADITGTQWNGQYDTTTYGDADIKLYLKNDNAVAKANYLRLKYTFALKAMLIDSTNGAATDVTATLPDGTLGTITPVFPDQQITLTAPVVAGYQFLGWIITGADAADITGTQWNGQYDTTTYGDSAIKVYLKSNNVIAKANYQVAAPVTCPAGEIEVATSTGTLIWAGSNLSGYRTFAENSYDYGCLFQWGYKDVIENIATDVDMPHSTFRSGDVWPKDQDPCPNGWRLPKKIEFVDLINGTNNNTSTISGNADGTYTGPNTWKTWTGEANGFKVVTKALNGVAAGQVLQFPNTGYRYAEGDMGGRNSMVRAWSSDVVTTGSSDVIPGSLAYALTVNTTSGATSASTKKFGMPVRCVKDVVEE